MLARVADNDTIREIRGEDEIRKAIESGQNIWIELESPCKEADDILVNVFDIHRLTIEDIWQKRSQPKLEDYRAYLYLIIHVIKGPKRVSLELAELDVLIGKTFVITHDPTGEITKDVVGELTRDCTLLRRGPAWLAHSILDHAVDRYLPVVDDLDSQLESLTNEALVKAGTPKGPPLLRRILKYKRLLQDLRRMSVHQREIFLRLSRGEFEEIPRETMPFYRDVYDHFLRINDLIESYRDVVTSALEAYLTVQSNRMNEIMKTLTMISTVMLPLTFIAGLYGMNFKHMPELSWVMGYPLALGVMAATVIVILLWFRAKHWIGNAPSDDEEEPKKPKPKAPKS
ncbi:MAG: magnesium/cobalt transporter CorA [Kofleriaceae bacterium]|nr:magnesium/cobalt transporter CorA [Kofleriaceae bacterium]